MQYDNAIHGSVSLDIVYQQWQRGDLMLNWMLLVFTVRVFENEYAIISYTSEIENWYNLYVLDLLSTYGST